MFMYLYTKPIYNDKLLKLLQGEKWPGNLPHLPEVQTGRWTTATETSMRLKSFSKCPGCPAPLPVVCFLLCAVIWCRLEGMSPCTGLKEHRNAFTRRHGGTEIIAQCARSQCAVLNLPCIVNRQFLQDKSMSSIVLLTYYSGLSTRIITKQDMWLERKIIWVLSSGHGLSIPPAPPSKHSGFTDTGLVFLPSAHHTGGEVWKRTEQSRACLSAPAKGKRGLAPSRQPLHQQPVRSLWRLKTARDLLRNNLNRAEAISRAGKGPIERVGGKGEDPSNFTCDKTKAAQKSSRKQRFIHSPFCRAAGLTAALRSLS